MTELVTCMSFIWTFRFSKACKWARDKWEYGGCYRWLWVWDTFNCQPVSRFYLRYKIHHLH